MSAIHFHHVSFSYSSAVTVIQDLSLSLGDGWTGLVGANGAGKTTLLRLVEGALTPVAGAIRLDPPAAVVAHCPQTADAIEANTAELATSNSGAAQTLRGRLELEPAHLERWRTLSPGERKRWQVGGALLRRPDVLMLDEPTNHLDEAARHLLLDALERFAGIGIIVSHDRVVLNGLCRRMLRLGRGKATLWHGGYSTARSEWEAAERAELQKFQRVAAERRKVARRLADKRRTAATKAARHRRQLRTAGPKDKDARSMEKKGRFAAGQKQGAHEMRLLRAAADRLTENAASFDTHRQFGGELRFDFDPARRRRLLVHEGPLGVADRQLVAAADVAVMRDDRILLTGPNGAGKSTLLRALYRQTTLDPLRILYLPQELTERGTRELLESVRRLDRSARGRVLGIVAVLGSDPERVLGTDRPSPGEARKLLIASGMGRGAWVLLLDEPTNHLDLPSIERLEAALAAYPGAMIVVTHDPDFARRTTQTRWIIGNGALTVE